MTPKSWILFSLLLGFVACAIELSRFWYLFVIAGGAALLIAFLGNGTSSPASVSPPSVVNAGRFLLPEVWSETDVSLAINQLGSNENLLTVYLDHIVARFILNQES